MLKNQRPSNLGVFMDEFFHFLVTDPTAKKPLLIALWGLVGVLGVIVILVVIGFFQGRSFSVWPPGVSEKPKTKGRKGKQEIDQEEIDIEESTLIDLPQSSDELATIVRSVWDEAVDAESQRLWSMIALLRDVYVSDNTVLLRLSSVTKSPYEIWKSESTRGTKSFKHIEKSIEMAMKLISDATRGDDVYSKRRASIALRNRDGYLYIVERDHLSQANEKRERFLISDSGQGSGVAGYVAYTKKSLRIPNVLDEPKFVQFHSTPKYKSLLCVPIMVGDYVFGTFSIDSTAEDAYTDEEEEFANICGNSIATSLIALMFCHAKHS